MTAAHLSETTLRQVAALFDEIASLASQIDRVCYFNDGDEDYERLALTLRQCRERVQKMGWIADLGCEKLGTYGSGQVRGGAEHWLLSPAYNGLGEPCASDGGAT